MSCRVFSARLLSTKVAYESFLSKVSARRKPSPIRALQPLLSIPDMISLGGGMPNPKTFPLGSLSFTLRDGKQIPLSPALLESALQYSPTPGLPPLVTWLKQLQATEHNMKNFEVCVTTGSQEALARAFEMLLNEGDTLLIESPTYSGSLACLQPLGVRLVEVLTDHLGLVPSALAATLNGWDASKGPKPRVLYSIPTGGNPTGASLTEERKVALYKIAQQHNLLILEDDPYYYLQFNQNRIRSLSSMDVDGRVLRFDSFSKILSSGLRIGFVSGPAPLIDRIQLHGQASSLHTSGLSQAVCFSILDAWGMEGFNKHVKGVCDFYAGQRDAFFAAAERHLKGLVEWNPHVSAGMFAWLRLLPVTDSFSLITKRAVEQKVLLVPGNAFFPEAAPPTSFVRASYSTASAGQMDLALQRLAALLRSV